MSFCGYFPRYSQFLQAILPFVDQYTLILKDSLSQLILSHYGTCQYTSILLRSFLQLVQKWDHKGCTLVYCSDVAFIQCRDLVCQIWKRRALNVKKELQSLLTWKQKGLTKARALKMSAKTTEISRNWYIVINMFCTCLQRALTLSEANILAHSQYTGTLTIYWHTNNILAHSLSQCTDCKCPYHVFCLLYTSPSPRDRQKSRMPSSA